MHAVDRRAWFSQGGACCGSSSSSAGWAHGAWRLTQAASEAGPWPGLFTNTDRVALHSARVRSLLSIRRGRLQRFELCDR
eukprot:5132796-Prymnesium_polylepis.1